MQKTIKSKCNFCGKSEFKFLFSKKDNKNEILKKFNLVKCEACGLIFINPGPSFKELEKHYSKKYYSFNKIKTKEKSNKVKLKLLLYDLYFRQKNKNYLGKLFFSPFLPYIRGTVIAPGRKILDVGSGSGQFLYEMKQFGMEVYGIEPGKFEEKGAKKHGLKIKKSDLMSAKYPKNYFDIITINHVLEHVSDPSEIIKEIHRILKTDGSLIVGVPNFRSLAHKIFRKNWYQFDVPRHLHNFSDKILEKKLKREGFKIEKIRYTSRPTQFSISLKYLLKLNIGNKVTRILDLFFLPLSYVVNFLKFSDEMEIYCKK